MGRSNAKGFVLEPYTFVFFRARIGLKLRLRALCKGMKMFSVGQKIWFVGSKMNLNPRQYEIEVTKVGRLWATLGKDGRYRCAADGQVDGGGYSSPGRCYASRQAYENEVARKTAWGQFRYVVDGQMTMPDGLTLGDLTQMLGSLGSDGGAGLQVGRLDPKWLLGAPSDGVEVAWLRLESKHPEGDVSYVILGCLSMGEGVWCEAADWKGESYNDPVIDVITHWKPYAVPSSSLDGA